MDASKRIDKYLWTVRIFKTRSIAIDACNGGKIKLNGTNTKPSKELKPGDKIDMVYSISVNEWNGNRELQLTIEDIKKV